MAKNELPWTDEEIVRSYKEARDPNRQIGVLADLNVCKPQQIWDVLKRAGMKLPKKPKESVTRKKKRMQSERSRAGFGGGRSILLERDGIMYTVKEVALVHGRSGNCVREHCLGTTVCVMGDTEYIVHRYRNPMQVEGK